MHKEKIIKFMFVSMWATLILMVVLKLTLNYYYPIVIENSKLLSLSMYLDERVWLTNLIDFIPFILNSTIIYLCSVREKWFVKKSHMIIIYSLYSCVYTAKAINLWLGFAVSLIPYIIVPLFTTRNKKRYVFIMFILDNIFQLLSNFARGNAIIVNNTYILDRMMLLDYYLMFIIYYIGGCHMGMPTVLPWFVKRETAINAKIEKYKDKIKKLEAQKECLKRQ